MSAVIAATQRKRKCERYAPENVHTYASTEMEQEIFTFLWSLKNFSELREVGDNIFSPVFRDRSNRGWQMKVFHKYKFENKEYLAAYLILNDFGGEDKIKTVVVKARFQISLVKASGLPGKTIGATAKPFEFTKGSDLGGKLIPIAELNSPTDGVIKDNAITLHCKVWIAGDLRHEVFSGGASTVSTAARDDNTKKRQEELSNDFGRIFEESVMTDITISTGSNGFSAHKAVLAARSSVFAAMLGTNMSEKVTNAVQITDFEGDVVKGMLEHLYTGATESLTLRAPELLRIAEKYDLQGLKEDCEYSICESLSVDNAAEMLNLAQMYDAVRLKTCVLDFIKCHTAEVIKTSGFALLQFAHPKVLFDLYLSQNG